MTEPLTEPRTTGQDTVRCEVPWECPEKCCPPERCGEPAVEQVVFLCPDGCGRATKMLLACRRCADVVAAQDTAPLTRLPL
jgi:hypothetical protein